MLPSILGFLKHWMHLVVVDSDEYTSRVRQESVLAARQKSNQPCVHKYLINLFKKYATSNLHNFCWNDIQLCPGIPQTMCLLQIRHHPSNLLACSVNFPLIQIKNCLPTKSALSFTLKLLGASTLRRKQRIDHIL